MNQDRYQQKMYETEMLRQYTTSMQQFAELVRARDVQFKQTPRITKHMERYSTFDSNYQFESSIKVDIDAVMEIKGEAIHYFMEYFENLQKEHNRLESDDVKRKDTKRKLDEFLSENPNFKQDLAEMMTAFKLAGLDIDASDVLT